MKISTEIRSAAALVGEERAIELIARSGFDAWDFSMNTSMASYSKERGCIVDGDHPLHGPNYSRFAKRLRKVGEDFGIVCNQSHAPFPTAVPGMRDYLLRAIECTAIAGAQICVIHPCNHWNAEKNAEMYLALLPFAKECGVRIATENMWNWDPQNDNASPAACSHHDDFLAHINAVGDPYLVACVDVGHAEMMGLNTTAEKMILTLGEHVEALHVHDNDLHYDMHQIPGGGRIDFNPVLRALKRINYSGYLTLESYNYLKSFTPDTAQEGIKELARSARALADEFESATF